MTTNSIGTAGADLRSKLIAGIGVVCCFAGAVYYNSYMNNAVTPEDLQKAARLDSCVKQRLLAGKAMARLEIPFMTDELGVWTNADLQRVVSHCKNLRVSNEKSVQIDEIQAKQKMALDELLTNKEK